MTIGRDEFVKRFGFEPVEYDLEKVNCDKVGILGHLTCGVCDQHKLPRSQCGCLAPMIRTNEIKR